MYNKLLSMERIIWKRCQQDNLTFMTKSLFIFHSTKKQVNTNCEFELNLEVVKNGMLQ